MSPIEQTAAHQLGIEYILFYSAVRGFGLPNALRNNK